jgi:hypothetical protein
MTKRKDPQPESLSPETPGAGVGAPEAQTVDTVTVEPVVAEVESPPTLEPAPELAPSPQPASIRRGIFGPLLGGALAAIGGFALSHFNLLGFATDSSGIPALTAQLEQATQQQAATEGRFDTDLADLADRVARLESTPPAAAPDLSRLDALDQRLAAIEAIPADGNASTAALTAKVAELEQRLASLPAGGTDPALQQKLDDALARLTEVEAAATARASEAAAATAAAAHAKALDALSAAVATGQPFPAELQALADPALTSALGSAAETGVPTLAQLQSDFPDAAREALRLARDLSTEDGWGTRLVDFLAAQSGARPLTPLEGNTPDAILSRAEFALSDGRVADALAELDPLDPVVKVALDPWMTRAKAHLAAAAALQAARGE